MAFYYFRIFLKEILIEIFKNYSIFCEFYKQTKNFTIFWNNNFANILKFRILKLKENGLINYWRNQDENRDGKNIGNGNLNSEYCLKNLNDNRKFEDNFNIFECEKLKNIKYLFINLIIFNIISLMIVLIEVFVHTL